MEKESENCNGSSRCFHFVLVHGAGHGAWCWYKLRHRLENAGHKVTCLDMAGSGIDPTDPNSITSFDDYDRPLMSFMSALPEHKKVILVGHSAGGLTVAHALNEFGSKISLAIFIAATMLKFGFQTDQDIKDGIPDISEYGEVHDNEHALGDDKPPTSMGFKEEFQRILLYQLSPSEDVTLASMLLRKVPAVFSTAKFDGDSVDKVRRVYVRTTCDNILKPHKQDAMIKKWPPRKVFDIDTDHSPFFSAPDQLFNILIKASTDEILEQ